jgi:hypothetical protein
MQEWDWALLIGLLAVAAPSRVLQPLNIMLCCGVVAGSGSYLQDMLLIAAKSKGLQPDTIKVRYHTAQFTHYMFAWFDILLWRVSPHTRYQLNKL